MPAEVPDGTPREWSNFLRPNSAGFRNNPLRTRQRIQLQKQCLETQMDEFLKYKAEFKKTFSHRLSQILLVLSWGELHT